MKLINMSVILAASLASTVQARHAVEPHLHPRSYDNSTYPATSTVVVSPVPVTSIPMGTGVSSVGESTTTKVTNATLTYTMGYGSSATVITTTVLRTETLTSTHVSNWLCQTF
jgi:phospholipid N-methyltransferase